MNNTNPVLNRLLPSKFEIAKSGVLIRTAAIDVASSGKEVLNARSCVPTKLSPHFINSAISFPAIERNTPLIITTTALPP